MARYTYTPGGRLATIESGNGIITRYTYDGEGNLSGLSVQKGEAWLLYAAAFTYDLRGNRLTKRGQRLGEGGRREKTHYHYAWIEEAGAVCPVIDFQETCCYNEGNQLTRRSSFGETTDYTYDANGSLVKETTVSPEGSGGKKEEKETFYHYDLLNRQVRVEGPEGRSTESHYDGEGLRAGLTTGKGESYTFLYHQGELMGGRREGSFWRRYLRGNGLVSLETEDQKYHSCHLDEQGSTLYLTDGQAEVENRYAYDAFGNLLGQEEAFPNRILYAGQLYDQETGQYYLRARYYNPTIGRFSQEDTYWGDGLNLYAYCANNPVRYFDPSGHQKKPNCPGTEGEAATDKQPGVEIESSRYSLPQGISQEQFSNASKLLRDRVGDISGDIVVQGSRAKGTAKPTSDIDIALRVSGDKFDSLINQYFKTPNPGSAKERTMLHAIETGKIQAGEAKLSGLRKELQEIFGMEVDISIIKQGGAFDNPPFIPFE